MITPQNTRALIAQTRRQEAPGVQIVHTSGSRETSVLSIPQSDIALFDEKHRGAMRDLLAEGMTQAQAYGMALKRILEMYPRWDPSRPTQEAVEPPTCEQKEAVQTEGTEG